MRLFLLLMLLSQLAFAQPASLTGMVTDSATLEPLPGTNVTISTEIGTVTDGSGQYSLSLPPGTYTVTFSYTGYQKQRHIVTMQTDDQLTLDVRLQRTGTNLNQVVVSSSRYEQSLNEVTTSMEVLQPETIEQFNQTSLSESLEYASGVNIIDGQPNIRGGSGYSYGAGSRVLLLQDGLPLLTGDAGFPIWRFIPIEQTGQVEIIKGASSVMYGSSALNGIVNFRTAYAKSEPVTSVTVFNGFYDKPGNDITDEVDQIMPIMENGQTVGFDTTFKTRHWWRGNPPSYQGLQFSHRQKLGQVDLIVGGMGYMETDYLQDSYERSARLSGRVRYRFKKVKGLSAGVGFNAMRSRSASFFLWKDDQSGALMPLDNTITENNATRLTIDPFVTWLPNKNTTHRLQGRFFKADNSTDTDQGTLSDLYFVNYLFQHRFSELDLLLSAGLTATHTLVEAELYGDTTHTASNQGAYVQLEKQFWKRLTLLAGARFERNRINQDPVDIQPVFRAGANLRIGQGTFVRASFGQGYRYPTVAERYVRTDVGAIRIFPNPDLGPETGYNAEVGIRQNFLWKGGGAFIDVAGFYSQYEDMMEFSFGGEDGTLFGFQSVNIGGTRIPGLEALIGVKHVLGEWTFGIQGGYTYIDPTYAVYDSVKDYYSTADYNVLKYRFRHLVNGQLQLGYKTLTLGLASRYYSHMEAIDAVFVILIPGVNDFRNEYDQGTWVHDLALNWQASEAIRIGLVVKNVCNVYYSLRPALVEEPRSFGVRVHGRF